MFLVFLSRSDLLRFLPPGGVVAEIGTAEGDFAVDILANASPRKLHLIDPWEFQSGAAYARDPNNVPQAEADARYNAVRARFAEPIAAGRVEIHRAYSPLAADGFADGYFDYVYIDGMHTKEAVLADLRGFDAKVKPDGLILGHDYTKHPGYLAMGFGVVETVNRFVIERGYEFTCLTHEGSPTYLLAKNPGSAARNHVLGGLMRKVLGVVEIVDAERREMMQRDVAGPDGKPFRTILSFR